ncbi:MAG: hypothetical protein IPI81_17100 [Flavobacteriales bacterium]|nr:hypothetical protein [Flavobacteriales bacterium]
MAPQALLTHDQTHLDAGCLKVDFSNNASSNVFTLKHNTLIRCRTDNGTA